MNVAENLGGKNGKRCAWKQKELPTRGTTTMRKRPPGNGAAEPDRKGYGRNKRKNLLGR